MINLIGCNKENFFKLLNLMDYQRKKIKEKKDNEDFFVYKPKVTKIKETINLKGKNNPFGKLSELRFR